MVCLNSEESDEKTIRRITGEVVICDNSTLGVADKWANSVRGTSLAGVGTSLKAHITLTELECIR